MKTFKAVLAYAIAILSMCSHAAATKAVENGAAAVSSTVYNDLVLYAKYCAASYGSVCPRPMGNILVERVRDASTGTDGMVVRDDRRREIVVAFRGTNIQLNLVPLWSAGPSNMGDARVHAGFLAAYKGVALEVLRIVQKQLVLNPSYAIVVTGHSLGGAIASLGAISIRNAHSRAQIKLFTFGQPRTGNSAFADYVERLIGVTNIFRAVHTWDGVVTLPPRLFGFEHFATEYWNFIDPPSRLTTRQCHGREDISCSAHIPSTGINPPHTVYFGQAMLATTSVCS